MSKTCRSKLGSSTPPCPLLSCPGFLQWWTLLLKCKSNMPSPPQLNFWSWCFVVTTEILWHWFSSFTSEYLLEWLYMLPLVLPGSYFRALLVQAPLWKIWFNSIPYQPHLSLSHSLMLVLSPSNYSDTVELTAIIFRAGIMMSMWASRVSHTNQDCFPFLVIFFSL